MRSYHRAVLGARLRRDRSLTALAVLGVALGVAAVLAIQVINANALAAFRGSVAAISGRADLTVRSAGPTLPDSTVLTVLADPGVTAAWPVRRLTVALESPPGYLDLTGVDLFQPTTLPGGPGRAEAPAGDPLATRGWIAVSARLAANRGLEVGDTLLATAGSRRVVLTVGALLDLEAAAVGAPSTLALIDIAQLHDLFGRGLGLSQVDLTVDGDTEADRVAERLARRLGPGHVIETPGERVASAAGLLGAFRLNLTALSTIAVLVGLFVVYGATRAALVRRRREFGVLRSLGATRGQVTILIATEVAVLGALGVLLGIPAGLAIANANLDAVSATVSNLYLLGEIESLELSPWLVALAASVGIGGALASAAPTITEVVRDHPVELLAPFRVHQRARTVARPMAFAGFGLIAIAGAWYALGGRELRVAGFVLATALVLGIALVTPEVVARWSRRVRVRSWGLGYAARTLGTRLQATAVAVAALAVAVMLLVGITVMVGSFRGSLVAWLESTIRADVYITTPSWSRATDGSPIDEDLVGELASWGEVVAIDRLRSTRVVLGALPTALNGVEASLPIAGRFDLLDAMPTVEDAIRSGNAVLVSEPLSRRLHLGTGDSLEVGVPGRVARLPVAGVHRDYGNEAGSVVMSLGTMAQVVGPGPVSNVALVLREGADPEAIITRIRDRWPDLPLVPRSNRTLRTEVLAVFDQTFAITRVLQLMALVIATSGVTLALLVMARERLPELALYRSLGATRRQLWTLFAGKGIAMAGFATALGSVGGAGLALILVLVVNPAFFGWTLQLHWPVRALTGQVILLVGAALVASAWPALRASRAPATALSRDDL